MRHLRRCSLVPAVATLMALTGATSVFAGGADRCAPRSGNSTSLRDLDLESLLSVKVITASKFAQSQSDAPGIISVVSQDELQRFGGATLREILERVPGLTSSSSYFTDRTIVAARGDQTKINGGHVLFLVNGRPTREVLEGGLASDLLESFPVNVLQRIEVIKGPGSVLYGSNAFSAVVNLITIQATGNGFSIGGAPGANGAHAFNGEGTFTCGDLNIVGGGQLHQKQDWTTTYWFNNPIPDDPWAAGVPVVQEASIRDRSRGGFASATYKGVSAMTSFTEWKTAAFVRGTVGENHWRRGFVDVGYRLQPTGAWTMNVNASYTRNLFAIEEYPFIKRDSHERVFEWSNVADLSLRDRLTFGLLYNRMEGRETYYGLGFPLDISSGRRSASAAYAQLDHWLIDSVKLIAGLQANKIGSVALDVVPRGGVIWNPARYVNVKALYGQAFRAPSLNETNLNHPGLVGTPGLSPEKVATFDLELRVRGERVEGGVNYFHSKQTDSITVDVSGQRWQYLNLGEATFQGIELEGKVYATHRLFVTGSFLHQVNEDGNGVSNVTPLPNSSAKGGISYQSDRLTASVFDAYDGAIDGYSSILNPRPSAHHMVGGHLRVELGAWLNAPRATGLAFVVNAENLTNNQVWLPDLGGNTGDTIPTRRGRTVYFGVEMSMGGRTGSRTTARN